MCGDSLQHIQDPIANTMLTFTLGLTALDLDSPSTFVVLTLALTNKQIRQRHE